MRRSRALLGPLLMVATTSCLAGFVWTMDYEFEPTAERRDSDGSRSVPTSSAGRQADLIVEDDLVTFSIDVRPGRIELTVRNESSSPLRLGFGQARFVHVDGRESELYVADSYQRDRPAPAVIAPASEVTIFLWPAEWVQGELGGPDPTSRADSPIDGSLFVEEERARAEARGRRHIGQSIGIQLPVEAGGGERSYRFTLKVTELVPRLISWA